MLIEIFIILAIAGYFLYRWSISKFNILTERGIPHKKPYPFVGNSWNMITQKMSVHKMMIDLYEETKQHKIFGFYSFRNPFFIINDPELVRLMGIKDFDSFANHQNLFDLDKDPIFGSMLTVMRDQRWRNMRNTVTPIFTGAKMRSMFTLMGECFDESLNYLRNKVNDKDGVDMEMKDCFMRLSNDLIATTAFGIKVNSFKDMDNIFFKLGRDMSNSQKKQAFKFLLFSAFPKLASLLGLKIIDKEKTDYFVSLVVDAMKYRKEHNIHRPDMIQLLMEAEKESEYKWTQNDIVAQCFIFFFAAFENNANFLCTTLLCLVEAPEAQDKLYAEIMEIAEELQGKPLDYDTLQNMKYMDMVTSESLRKYSIAPIIDRECGKDYTVKDGNGKFICNLKKGDHVWYHTVGFHWSEDFFENAKEFIPERFSKENKHKIQPCTYNPFGIGLRNCIGNRYALMQAKAMLYYMLKEFRVERSPKTVTNLYENISGFQMTPKDGYWFKLVSRN